MRGQDAAGKGARLADAAFCPGDQDGGGDFEGLGQGFDYIKGGALAAELDDGDVVAGEAGLESELLLGQFFLEPALADGFAESASELLGRHEVAALFGVAFGRSSNYRWNVGSRWESWVSGVAIRTEAVLCSAVDGLGRVYGRV